MLFLSIEETPDVKPPYESDVLEKLDSPYGLIGLSILDLGRRGEVVLVSQGGGTRVAFRIYGIGDNMLPVLLLEGIGDDVPKCVSLLDTEGPVVWITNHETGDFSRYFVTLYGAQNGKLKAIKAYEADQKTKLELKGIVREIPSQTIDRYNMPNKRLERNAGAVSPSTTSSPAGVAHP
jgi:hypothetical protein